MKPLYYALLDDGTVANDPARVVIDVSGPASAVEELVRRLRTEAPPMARIDRIDRIAGQWHQRRAMRIEQRPITATRP